jgi:hypothetical protein
MTVTRLSDKAVVRLVEDTAEAVGGFCQISGQLAESAPSG